MKNNSFTLLFIIIFATLSFAQTHAGEFDYPPDADTVRYIPYRKGNSWFFIDKQSKGSYTGHANVFNKEWDKVLPFNEYGLALVEKDGFNGWINNKGKIIIPLEYKDMSYIKRRRYVNGHMSMYDKDKNVILFNTKGDIVAKGNKGDTYRTVINGEFVIKNTETISYGIMDTLGNWKIPMGKYKYLNIYRLTDTSNIYIYGLHNEYARYKSKYGIMLSDGTIIADTLYEQMTGSKYGVCSVRLPEGRDGLYNVHKRKVVKDYYGGILPFHSGVATVNGGYMKKGMIDTTGKIILPQEYRSLATYGESGYIAAKKNGKWGVVSYHTGKPTSEFIYDHKELFGYKWGMFVFIKDGKGGVVDPWGNIIIPFEYDVSTDGSVPYINTLTPNLIAARKNGEWFLLNRKHEIVTTTGKDEISPSRFRLEHGLIEVYKKGYMDLQGNKYWED